MELSFFIFKGDNMTELTKFIKHLKQSGLTPQQFKTLKGQALNGDIIGARKGLNKIKGRNSTEYNRKDGTHFDRQACSLHK